MSDHIREPFSTLTPGKSGRKTLGDYERQHVDMIYHISLLHQRNDKLQARLDQAQAEIARHAAKKLNGVKYASLSYISDQTEHHHTHCTEHTWEKVGEDMVKCKKCRLACDYKDSQITSCPCEFCAKSIRPWGALVQLGERS